MSTSKSKARALVQWIWSHTSAAVALALIVVALMVGYSIGSPAADTTIINDSAHEHDAADNTPTVYTCSMHPNVRLPDADAKCPICFMGLIPVVDTAIGDDTQNQLQLSQSASAMSRIETSKVARFFPTAQVRLYGKLGYDETSVARITAYFPGRIERLFVNYVGVGVQKGDHLAELYSPDLLAAFEELNQAKKAMEQSDNTNTFLHETNAQILDAARERLRLFGITQSQIIQVESGTFDTTQLTIYSPIGGVVTTLSTRQGDYIETGEPIATIADLSRLWLDLEAYESQLPMLRWGLPITFTVEAHPGETFEGRISFIEPMIDQHTRTAAVRVAVDNTDGRLKPGMFATAVAHPKIAAGGAVISDELAGRWVSPMHPTIVKDGPGACDVCGMDLVTAESLGIVGDSTLIETPLVIPRTAVLFTGTRSVVFIQLPNQDQPTYEGRVVHLGPLAGEFYTVRSGLNEGDQIVTHGAFRVDSAMQILAKPSMMTPQHEDSVSPNDINGYIPITFVTDLDPIYNAYLDTQERLADDDFEGYIVSATALQSAVQAQSVDGLVGDPLGVWRRSSAQLIAISTTTNITDARQQFESMTKAVMDLQQYFGHTKNTLHVAYCPMAFDFKGAQWIQRGTEINNPYFGDQMLRCGDLQETLNPIDHKGHSDD